LRCALIASFGLLSAVGPAWAGAPFLTDDPEPVGYDHWEVYGFSMGSHAQGDRSGTLAGVDANFGAAENVQLHLIAPLAFDDPGDSASRTGIGDIELGVKYRFVDPGPNDWWPQVAVYPLLEVPTGDADQGLGNSHERAFLPVWLQKDLGEWKTYGGGGLWINPGTGNQNYWFFGWLLQRQFTDQLAVGAELFHQTKDADDGKDTSGFNVGAIYDLTDNYHVLCSAGRGVQNAAQTNEFSYYLAVQWTFGPAAEN
jgi:hypothetical protein